MIPIDDIRPETDRVDDNDEEYFEMDPMDDDVIFDDFEIKNDQDDRQMVSPDRVPLWRLIEMDREDRHLKWTIADFADYDELADFDGDYAGESSY